MAYTVRMALDSKLIVRVHVAMLAGIGFYYMATGAGDVVAATPAASPFRGELAVLEDAVAEHPDDTAQTAALLQVYLDRNRPALAVAVLRAGDVSLLDDPMVAHRMAEAYERVGRPLEALATAKVARARCARVLGSLEAGSFTPIPDVSCSESLYAALDAHVTALDHMVRWGVVLPDQDPRAVKAYRIALRRASIAARLVP